MRPKAIKESQKNKTKKIKSQEEKTNQEKIGEIFQSKFENKLFIQAVRTREEILKLKIKINNTLKITLLLKEDKEKNRIRQGLPFLLWTVS